MSDRQVVTGLEVKRPEMRRAAHQDDLEHGEAKSDQIFLRDHRKPPGDRTTVVSGKRTPFQFGNATPRRQRAAEDFEQGRFPGAVGSDDREQLARMLDRTGFDPAQDIQGITVNRWAHGYAYTPNSLFDPDWRQEQKPWVIGRQRFGNIAIANSDAGANAYTNEAIDQAFRAIQDLQTT